MTADLRRVILMTIKLSFLKKRFLGGFFLVIYACSVHASEYTPPSSPELYDSSKTPELQKIVKNSTGVYGGLQLAVGQSRSGDFNPITAFSGHIDLGYRKIINSWTLWEAGVEIMHGKAGHSQADMSLSWGGLVKLAYGYSLNQGINGII